MAAVHEWHAKGSSQAILSGFHSTMRKLLLLALVPVIALVGYAAWPLISAFQIKQAIKAGDVATLERKVHWEPVRASLKASLAGLSPRAPVVASADDNTSPRAPRAPSLWSRVKAAAAPYFADRLIDTYVTAEGVTKLQQLKRDGIAGLFGGTSSSGSQSTQAAIADASEDGTNPLAKFVNFYNRIQSARFHSLTVAEFEVLDRNNPARKFISQFHFSDFDWKLVSIRIVGEAF